MTAPTAKEERARRKWARAVRVKLDKYGITKVDLCTRARISRSTLDAFLASSKTRPITRAAIARELDLKPEDLGA